MIIPHDTAILIDFSQIIHRITHAFFSSNQREMDLDLFRSAVFRTILSARKRIQHPGEIIICFDSKNNWRKVEFPFYKENRKLKKIKEANKRLLAGDNTPTIDWDKVYEMVDKITEEILNELPLKSFKVDGAEADDIIYQLAVNYPDYTKVIVFSTDKDFLQLMSFRSGIRQFDPIELKWITPEELNFSLFEKVITGDKGDGVPNFISDSDTFLVEGKRQTSLKEKRKDHILSDPEYYNKPDQFCFTITEIENFERNKKLIDLSMCPEEIQEKIRERIDNHSMVGRCSWREFCIKFSMYETLEMYPSLNY